MINPKIKSQNQIVVSPDSDAFHFLDTKGNIIGWIDGTGTPQGNTSSGTGSSINFSDGEIPSGEIDGNNNVFTLFNSPNPPASLQLFINGVLQPATVAGGIITLSFAPQPGDLLEAFYRY